MFTPSLRARAWQGRKLAKPLRSSPSTRFPRARQCSRMAACWRREAPIPNYLRECLARLYSLRAPTFLLATGFLEWCKSDRFSAGTISILDLHTISASSPRLWYGGLAKRGADARLLAGMSALGPHREFAKSWHSEGCVNLISALLRSAGCV